MRCVTTGEGWRGWVLERGGGGGAGTGEGWRGWGRTGEGWRVPNDRLVLAVAFSFALMGKPEEKIEWRTRSGGEGKGGEEASGRGEE